MSYTLITANRNYSSWSLRPWILMKALEIPFDERIVPFAAPDNYATFRAFAPNGQVPCLLDGELVVWDSLGITMYLADRETGIWPTEEAARAWAMCAVAEMHSGFDTLRKDCRFNVGVRIKPPPQSPELSRQLARIGELWADGLSRFGGPWLGGDLFTAADAFFAPVAFRVRTYDLDVGEPGANWVKRILDHPAMQEWEAAALREPWREQDFEDELAAAGLITADYRI